MEAPKKLIMIAKWEPVEYHLIGVSLYSGQEQGTNNNEDGKEYVFNLIHFVCRCCPEIEKLYLLIRPKKGKEPRERISEIFSNPVSTQMC